MRAEFAPSYAFQEDDLSWTFYFYVRSTNNTKYYQYKDTDVVALPQDLVQPPSDLPVSFGGCKHLVDISVLRKWDMSKATSTRCMFRHCHELSDLSPIAGWDMSMVTDMSYMFFRCNGLKDISVLKNWELKPSAMMEFMFEGCSGLSEYIQKQIQSFSPWRIYMAICRGDGTAMEIRKGEMVYYEMLEEMEIGTE